MPEPKPTLSILVVEDDADTRSLLERFLNGLGYSVVTARTVSEALAKLASVSFDVLLSDIGLPDGSGWTLLDEAKHRESLYSIAMSGFGLAGDRVKSKAAGYRHYLLKPFDPDDLLRMLEEASDELGKRTKP